MSLFGPLLKGASGSSLVQLSKRLRTDRQHCGVELCYKVYRLSKYGRPNFDINYDRYIFVYGLKSKIYCSTSTEIQSDQLNNRKFIVDGF